MNTIDVHQLGGLVFTIGMLRSGELLRSGNQHPIPFENGDHVQAVLAELAVRVGSLETALVCLMCKVLVDAHGNDTLTSDDYWMLSTASGDNLKQPQVHALLNFAEFVDLDGEIGELVKCAELLMRMLSGSLCADALNRMLDALHDECSRRPDLSMPDFDFVRDRRISELMACS